MMKLSIIDLEIMRDGVERIMNEREKKYLDTDVSSCCYTMYQAQYEMAHTLLGKIDFELAERKAREE